MTTPRRWGTRADRWFASRYDALQQKNEETWLGAARARLLGGLAGDVLELGPGTGANRPHYPADVGRLVLLEPSPFMRERLESAYAGADPAPEILPVGDEGLANLPDDSFDAVVVTLVLCSVPDPPETIAHLRRVLRPTGRLVVLEHVHAGGVTGALQTLVSPLTERLTHGCRRDRRTVAALAAGGFDVVDLEPIAGAGGTLGRPMVAGVCRAA